MCAGRWTHLAARYSSAESTLTLYTNGSIRIATNSFFAAPPINGKVGDDFVRIGEGFMGLIDDVQIWNTPRPSTDIAGTYNIIWGGGSSNLIHYFRFDDGQATTNEFPFGPYHQPQGPQDFVYTADWNAQWRHAGRMVGDVEFRQPGALLAPPSITVILDPEGARLAGARWSLDGGPWLGSGDTVGNLDLKI